MKPVWITAQAVAFASLLAAGPALAQTTDQSQDDPSDHAHDPWAEEDEDEDAAAWDPLEEERERERERAREERREAERAREERRATERTRTDIDDRDVVVVDRDEADEREQQPLGVGFMFGGGVTGFATDAMTDVTDIGGSWEARVTTGTRTPIGLELGYIGSAQDIDAVGLDEDAILLGNGAEAVARLNVIGQGPVQPYAFGGAGYRNYRITNTDENLSNLADSDNVFEIPVGAGLNFSLGQGVLLDLRGTYRVAIDDDLTAAEPGEDQEVGSNLNNWGATLRLGYEF